MPRSLAVLVLTAMLCLSCEMDTPVQPAPPDGNRPPVVAQVLGTISTFEGGIAQFWAREPNDPDGDSLSYAWDLGDGSRGTHGVSVEHTYIDDGVYPVTVVVSDSRGAADTATATVTIMNHAPYISTLALLTAPLPAPLPATAVAQVRFEDLGVLDNPRLAIDWGDGTVSGDTTHVYVLPGVYTIAVTVTDKDGAASTNVIGDPVWVYDASQSPGTPPGYDVVDLGNLGGNRAMPASLNNHGEIVGTSMTADSQHHAFLWKAGVMSDIGISLQGSSTAQTINDAGWIGGALTADRLLDNSLVVWRSGSVSLVRTGGEDNRASAVEVNAAGDVLVNIAGHELGSSALLRNGELVRLGGLNAIGGRATASDMNSHDQVVGTSPFLVIGPQRYQFRAFRWEDGVMEDLGDLGYACDAESYPDDCGYSAAFSINDRGQIVGATRRPGGLLRAVIWEAGSRTPQDLGFGTGASRAVAINERGQVAGDSDDPGEGYFRDADATVVTLGSLGGGGTQVTAMNEAGLVIGWSKTATGAVHPFVWHRSTGMTDLGVERYGGKGIGAFPVAINDRGDVTGYVVPCQSAQNGGCLTWGVARAILWRTKAPAVVTR